jgi:hypothetical protein
MDNEKKIILFGASTVGISALQYFGTSRVHCFADNYKAGQFFCKKNVISFEELKNIYKNYNIVVSVIPFFIEEIEKQFNDVGIDFINFNEIIKPEDFPQDPKILKLKNIHKGKRCFVVCTGPSLEYCDLEKIRENCDISFSMNSIYKIFDNTKWRPDYYCCIDKVMLEIGKYFIESSDWLRGKFFFYYNNLTYEKENEYYFNRIWKPNMNSEIETDLDLSRCSTAHGSVTHFTLRMAMYMGFNEIYLLGCDNTIGVHKYKENFEKEVMNRVTNYYSEPMHKIISISKSIEYTDSEYIALDKITRKHGNTRIFNATRGGKLEAFERVNFDLLFNA